MKTTTCKITNRQYFGENSRFCLIEFLDRFGKTQYFIKDAEDCDDNGYSNVVFQTRNKIAAVKKFGFQINMNGEIIKSQ